METNEILQANNKVDIWNSPTTTGLDTPEAIEIPPTPEVNTVLDTPPVAPPTTPDVTPSPEIPVVETVVPQDAPLVEKAVDKPFVFKNDLSKAIYEAIESGDKAAMDTIYKVLDEQNRDYVSMADYDVIKHNLKATNPKWGAKDIEIEMKSKYGHINKQIDLNGIDQDLDPDSYSEAEKFNQRVEEKELLMARDARDARLSLEELKQTIELPKLNTPNPVAEQPQYTEQELHDLKTQWDKSVDETIPNLSDIKFKVGDEEVTYKATVEEKAEFNQIMKDFDDVGYLTKRGWYDEQGNMNILQIAEDVRKLEKFDKIVSSAGTQMKTLAKKDVIAEIKNIDIQPNQTTPNIGADVASAIWN